jgi:hypothetical protein
MGAKLATLLRRPRIEDLFDAWAFAADEARRALDAWQTCHTSERADAFAVYRAALDREGKAAEVFAAGALRAA